MTPRYGNNEPYLPLSNDMADVVRQCGTKEKPYGFFQNLIKPGLTSL